MTALIEFYPINFFSLWGFILKGSFDETPQPKPLFQMGVGPPLRVFWVLLFFRAARCPADVPLLLPVLRMIAHESSNCGALVPPILGFRGDILSPSLLHRLPVGLGFVIIAALPGLYERIQECLSSMLLPLPSSQNPRKPFKILSDAR